jgi:hypothetical protein
VYSDLLKLASFGRFRYRVDNQQISARAERFFGVLQTTIFWSFENDDTSERESRRFSIGPVDKLANPTFFSLARRNLSSITFNLVSTGPIASMCKHVGS